MRPRRPRRDVVVGEEPGDGGLPLVVAGSCQVGGMTTAAGDMWVDLPGASVEPVVAGPDGLDEVVVPADRRFLDVDASLDG